MGSLLPVLSRFLLYGVAGWTLEVLFTGACSAVGRDRSATARTYLWMHPIDGAAALGLEQIELRLKQKHVPFVARAAVHTVAIYGAEYGTGFLLKRVLRKCPWDYGESGGRSVQGLRRLDYAPLWFAVGALFTLARPWLAQMAEPRTRWGAFKQAVLPRSEGPLLPLSAVRSFKRVLRAPF